ncbi:MAG: response regulator [Gemmatimonadetes bacterium]|nr:response regulator [Gemmatimonadota bacterium]
MESAGRRETGPVVFFVDDDAGLRKLVARVLAKRGFTTILAGTAEEAMHLWEEHEGHVDALLVDINLPDGWGSVLAQRLRAARPEVPLVYTTGFADVDPILSAGLNDTLYVLRKPFTTAELVGTLERAIENSRPYAGPET